MNKIDNHSRFESLVFSLGRTAALMSYPEVEAKLVHAIRKQTLRIDYVTLVHEQLGRVLAQAAAEEPKEAGKT